MSFFDITNPELFRPLTGVNKQRYMDVLSLLWEECRRKPLYTIYKYEMTDIVEKYLTGVGEDLVAEDELDDEAPEGGDIRSQATFIIRRLRSTGWIKERESEYEEDSKLALNHHIIPLLKSFVDVVNPKIVTYKGKLFEIYSMLSRVQEIDDPYESCLKEADENLKELNFSLHSLAASIEEHIDNLTKGKSPEEILAFFDEYEERIVVGSYQRFKTNDNLFYYRSGLYEQLDLCEESLFDSIVKNYQEAERSFESEARYEVNKLISSMRESLEEMETIMRDIDDRHIIYRTRAVQRAQFLISSDGSTKGKINGLLKYYASEITSKNDLSLIDDSVVNNAFQIYSQGFFDQNSIYAPQKKKKATPISIMNPIEEPDEEFIIEQQKALMEYARNALTSDNVNRFAKEMLGNRNAVLASSVLENESDAVVKLIGIYTYSLSPGRLYNVKIKDSVVTIGGIRFNDFIIERK
ncbi:MAG: hypothetical protein J6A58_02250 [Oscillospiraceae bacterium]|nr:hypothetical protein [Oscillospiraceae bacterium]